MSESIEQLKEEAALFGKTQVEYRHKEKILQNWKTQFQQLEQEVSRLISFFENEYEKSAINDGFPEDIKAKLENRRDGIRLSVKSATRLLRKLNPDKPLEDHTEEFITPEEMSERLKQFSEQLIIQADNGEDQTDADAGQNGEEREPIGVLKKLADCEEAVILTDEEKTEKQEASADPKQEEEQISAQIMLLQAAIESNQTVIQQLDDYIQAAQKRFITFIEKSVAPILDGLFSGEKYAQDLIAELKTSDAETIGKAEEWLGIYGILMNEIKHFFQRFSVGHFGAEMGELFDEEKHEPIGVVENDDFADEQIKELVRYGLTFESSLSAEKSFLIRPAQVIVVKNKKHKTLEQ